MNVKNCELPQILPHLRAHEPAGHSGTETGQDGQLLGQRWRALHYWQDSRRISIFVLVSCTSFPKGWCEEGVRWHLLMPWVALQRETRSYESPIFCYMPGSECPGRRLDISRGEKEACLHLLQKQRCLCLPHRPWKASLGNTADTALAEIYPSVAGIAPRVSKKVRPIKAVLDRATGVALCFLRWTVTPCLSSLLHSWRGGGTAAAAQWTSGLGLAKSCISGRLCWVGDRVSPKGPAATFHGKLRCHGRRWALSVSFLFVKWGLLGPSQLDSHWVGLKSSLSGNVRPESHQVSGGSGGQFQQEPSSKLIVAF